MSKTVLSAFVIILVGIFQILGIEVTSEKVQTAIEVVLQLVAAIIIWAQRIKRGDVGLLGNRKEL